MGGLVIVYEKKACAEEINTGPKITLNHNNSALS
jgi:hypothetical protein